MLTSSKAINMHFNSNHASPKLAEIDLIMFLFKHLSQKVTLGNVWRGQQLTK